jgi:uncharacterized protein (TIGR03435 family)
MAVATLTVSSALAQAPAAPPAFDVASVKRVPGPARQRPLRTEPDGVSVLSVLGYVIEWAYASGPQQSRLEDLKGPDWLLYPSTELYDIGAKASGPVSTGELRLMMRTLLASRFKLVVHRESRVVPVLAVVVGKDGPKLTRAASMGEGAPRSSAPGQMNYSYQGFTMAQFADDLDRMTRTPGTPHVVDQTGLAGPFDFTFDLQQYLDKDASGHVLRDERGEVDIVTMINRALPELGLRLETARAPVEVLVIDHVEKEPTAN